MSVERHVRVFRNGRSRAVRIPKEFEFEGSEVLMRKEGDRLIIEPVNDRATKLRALLEEWRRRGPITDEQWTEPDDPPPEPVDF